MRTWWLLVSLAGCGRLGFEGMDHDSATLAERQVLYMQFDDDLADAVSGSLADCTGTECPAYGDGVVGRAAVFDGVDDCLRVPWMTSWVPEQFTLSAWVSLDVMTAPVVVKQYGGVCPTAALEIANSSVGMVLLDEADTHKEAWTAQLVQPQTWHAVSVRWDGFDQRVFVDGTCACGIAPPRKLLFGDAELTLGCYPAGSKLLVGAVDEIRIHDRALSSIEIAALATVDGQDSPTPAECLELCATVAP